MGDNKPNFKNNKKRQKFVHPKKPKNPNSIESIREEILNLQAQYETVETAKITKFTDIPLSRRTIEGLNESEYYEPTDIQKEAVILALRGLDILGAAKTGSGKTLAFIIPVLECLSTKLWAKMDGLGALIITPTRELAYQIFETLRNVGRKHDFSAGLIIGGKDLKFEKKRMDQVNVIICTPGRLLQHMDENPNFDCSNLQILVLDEADRCLDLGFEQAMNAIIANLPTERQTLLFSATQTKSVKDLARLSLKSPVYISVHENAQFSTPETLQQSYIVCPLENKLDLLWSFLKNHKKSKILVFMSSCKQVRFVNMLFCRMRPGMSLLALYGSLHQLKRMDCYKQFCEKKAVVLFATDLAARGLDFPEVDWVIQLDCPEDANTYIHRAGRTARFNRNGEALLVLLPSEEEAFTKQLSDKKIPIEKIEVNQKKMSTVVRKFEALLARDVNLKDCAQRAFKSYLKSCFLMKNKQVFDVTKVDLSAFARSLGLAVAPRVRFLQKRLPKNSNNKNEEDSEESEGDGEMDENEGNGYKYKKIELNSNKNSTYDFSLQDEDEDIETLFLSKKPKLDLEDEDEELNDEQLYKKSSKKTKASLAKKLIKKNLCINKKTVFDDEGEALLDPHKERQSEMAKSYEKEDASGIDVEKAKEILQLEDKYDREIFKERIRAKHREEKLKAKMAKKKEENEAPGKAVLGNYDDDDNEEEEEDEEEEENSESE